MTDKNLMTTLEEGRTSTWRFPRFSALTMLVRQSFSTLIRTILAAELLSIMYVYVCFLQSRTVQSGKV